MVAWLACQAHPLHIEFTFTREGDERRRCKRTPLIFISFYIRRSAAHFFSYCPFSIKKRSNLQLPVWSCSFSLGFFKPQQSDLAPYPIALNPQRPTSFTEGLLGKWSKSLTAELPGNDFLNCALIPFCTVLTPLGASLCLACLPALLSLP